MIDDALRFLLDRLNRDLPRSTSAAPSEKLFSFVGMDKDDAISFKPDTVSLLMVRIEEDTALRSADRYARVTDNGIWERVQPEIRLQLWVLFAARFPDYGQALLQLSRVLRYFQRHRAFTREEFPDLKPELRQLQIELVTPTFAEQNEIWGALRVGYLPNALYKVKLLVFEDTQPTVPASIKEVVRNIEQATP